jgi:hypothetical protein
MNTVSEFTREAVTSYLRTVVLVDDNIFRQPTVAPTTTEIVPPRPARKTAFKAAAAPSKKTVSPSRVPDEPIFLPHHLVASFAKKKIVCSLYQPANRSVSVGITSDIFHICSSADIVILDYDLFGDGGTKALGLINNLVSDSMQEIPEQGRLILVYTLDPNLTQVSNQILASVDSIPGVSAVPEDPLGLVLSARHCRISILGKPNHRLPQFVPYTIPEQDLAARAIQEFSAMAPGLLQACVLLGLAKVREKSRTMLARFDSSLDAAFIQHNSLARSEGAFENALPLVMAELQSVLEDRLQSPLIPAAVLDDWVANVWSPSAHIVGSRGIAATRAQAKILCRDGHEATGLTISNAERLKFFSSSSTSTENDEFALLMSTRGEYAQKRKQLQLGTIATFPNGLHYVCLQPVCDSVRLSGRVPFLFVQLSQLKQSKNARVVIRVDDAYLELSVETKIASAALVSFAASGGIVASSNTAPHEFCDCDGKKYLWNSQLKWAHAQRIVEQFASELSRVGLTESEWLRLKR